MKARIRHIYEIIAGAILSLFGFSGCEGIEDIIYPKSEYGMPHATFAIKGTVKAEDTGNPVEGIKVKFRQKQEEYDENGNPFYIEKEFTSDKEGKVEGSFTEWPNDKNIEFTFEDIDKGENGGWFAPDTLRGSDVKIVLEEDKSSNWYKGTYHISFDEKLKRDYTEPVD